MDYEGYTFVFFYQNINKIFSLKYDLYHALTFQRLKIVFKMQVTFSCLNYREVILHLIISLLYE